MRQVAECIKYLQSSICQNVHIALCIHIIIYNIHGYISVRRVCKHDPVE